MIHRGYVLPDSVIEEMTSLSDNDTQKVCITRLCYRGNDKSQTMIHRGYVLPDRLFACLMVFNATFNNISVISWR
jgi:hypothetical protein